MNMPGLYKTLFNRDLSLSMTSQVFVSGFNFLIGIVAARLLGVSDFGLFTLILMISSLTMTAQGHLLTLPMMTFAGLRANRSSGYFAAITRLSFLSSLMSAAIVAMILVVVFTLRGDAISTNLLAAAAFITFCQNHQITLRLVLFARRQRGQALAMDISRLALMVILSVALINYGISFDVTSLLYLLGGSALLASLLNTWQVLRIPVKKRMILTVVRRHWPMSQWMLLMLLVSLGQEQAIWVIVGIELGDTAVGALRAGQYLLGLTHIVSLAIEYFMPRNAAEELQRAGVPGLRAYLMHQTIALGGVALCAMALIAIFAEQSLAVVFGDDYIAFADITRIYAVTYFIIFMRSIWTYYLRATENTRSVFLAHLTSSLTAIVLIYPLMSQFGIVGVAYCVLIAQFVCFAMIMSNVVCNNERILAH